MAHLHIVIRVSSWNVSVMTQGGKTKLKEPHKTENLQYFHWETLKCSEWVCGTGFKPWDPSEAKLPKFRTLRAGVSLWVRCLISHHSWGRAQLSWWAAGGSAEVLKHRCQMLKGNPPDLQLLPQGHTAAVGTALYLTGLCRCFGYQEHLSQSKAPKFW